MAAERSWQAITAEARGGSDAPFSDARIEQQSVESLLRRLINRVEESERRYGEALDELHVRLDHLSRATDTAPADTSPEEAETLERLRSQLSSLTRRVEHPEAIEAELDDVAKLGRALAEARAAAADLAAMEPGLFAPSPPSDLVVIQDEPAFSFGTPEGDRAPAFVAPSAEGEQAELDQRLIEMAQRLERSIGESVPSTAIEMLNSRMEEIAARLEVALEQTPKLEHLQQLERQITEMGQQLGRAEQQFARISAIEGQLQRLIERFEEAPVQMQKVVSKAAQEAARLASEASANRPSAAERIDAIHRDIMAMNERNRVTEDRVADTLTAMHDSLKGLVQQAERSREPSLTPAQTQHIAERTSAFAERSRLATLQDLEDAAPAPAFGRAKRASFASKAVDFEGDSTRGPLFASGAPLDSTQDLVAAARRAAQAAAARAEERGRLRLRKATGADEPILPTDTELPERRNRSTLMVIAALLLMVSAALLYSRLQLKPVPETPSPTAEQPAPAPGTDATPPIELAPGSAAPPPEAAPSLEAEPTPQADPTPDVAPAPAVMPEAPHVSTPPAPSHESELAPPVRFSETGAATAAASLQAMAGWQTITTQDEAEPTASTQTEPTRF